MPEPVDVIVPMLQRLQGDVSEMKRDIRGDLHQLNERMGTLEERFEAFGPYITLTMGLHAQNRADVDLHRDDIAEIKKRLDALEADRRV